MSQVREQVVIANGATLSGEFACPDRVVVGIIIPSSWTAANITFAATTVDAGTGGTYYPVYDAAGTELTITVTGASTAIVIAPDATRSFKAIKFRSGTVGAAVAQGADRTLTIVTIDDIRS